MYLLWLFACKLELFSCNGILDSGLALNVNNIETDAVMLEVWKPLITQISRNKSTVSSVYSLGDSDDVDIYREIDKGLKISLNGKMFFMFI